MYNHFILYTLEHYEKSKKDMVLSRIVEQQEDIIKLIFHNFISTSDRAGSANNSVDKSCVHIPDSYKLVEEIHVHLKIGGGYKECSQTGGKTKTEEEEKGNRITTTSTDCVSGTSPQPEMIGDLLICIFKMAAQREFGF